MSECKLKFVPPVHPGTGPYWVGHFEVMREREQAEQVEVCLTNRKGEELCPELDPSSLAKIIETRGEQMIRDCLAAGQQLPSRLTIGTDA